VQGSILRRVCAVAALIALGMLLSLCPVGVGSTWHLPSDGDEAVKHPAPASSASLAAPTDLTATAIGPFSVALGWTGGAAGVEGYELERSTDGGWTYHSLAVLSPEETAYDDAKVVPCTQYCYRMRAVAGGEASPYSNVARATTPSEPVRATVVVVDAEGFEGPFPPPGWLETPWSTSNYLNDYGGYRADYYARTISGSPGYLRTPAFDCSEATEVAISFWMRTKLGESEVYEVRLEAGEQSGMLESFTTTGYTWQWKTYTISDLQQFPPPCTVSWYGATTGGFAHLDLVTVSMDTESAGPPPTTIDAHPADRTVCAGDAATFSVVASGADLSYRWEVYDGTEWADLGVSGPELTLHGVSTAQDGSLYRSVVSGACATAYSHPATLHVTPATLITEHPQDAAACAGGTVALDVAAIGSGLAYAWEFDDGQGSGPQPLVDGPGVSGASTPHLVLSDLDASRAGSYRAVVTGACGTAVSPPALVTLLQPTVILEHPNDQTVMEHSSATFCVQAQGAELSYMWEHSTDGGQSYEPIPETTEVCLTLYDVSHKDDGRLFRCVVSGVCNSATTEPAVLSVLRAHLIPLHEGWNLVSMAVRPVDTAIEYVLSNIAGQYRTVYAWRNGEWHLYDPAAIPPGTLTALDETHGFWIDMIGPATLNIVGKHLVQPSAVPLDPGWNLIGYPGWTGRALPDALSHFGVSSFTLVYGYGIDGPTAWLRYDPLAPAWSNSLAEMAPGSGYWVRVEEEATWLLPPD